MYRVLLIDDEPLILSGIKFMIDWAANDCQIVGTARNGEQGWEKLKALKPDIVICDIAMPALSGSELLERAAAESPATVFIMLTNHPDFHLAQHSLRFRAVDYLLKSELDAPMLEKTLVHAKVECASRAKLARVELVDDYLETNRKQLLEDSFLAVMLSQPGTFNTAAAGVLAKNGVLNHYGVAYIALQFEQTPDEAPKTPDERADLFHWVTELCEETAAGQFPAYALFSPDDPAQSGALFLLCWDLPEGAWTERLRAWAEKADASCKTITRTAICAMATDAFEGADGLEECRKQVFALRDHYYLDGGHNGRFYSELPAVEWGRLMLGGLASRLAVELRAKNASGCAQLMERAIRRVATVPHQQNQALWLCGEIYSVVAEPLGGDTAAGRRAVEQLATRAQVLRWLERTSNELADYLTAAASPGRSQLAEKAREYVRNNVEKRIMLQDVADYVCISPGYLSALFKKEYNQNLVDYINEVKIHRACELIAEGKYRIYEISYMLGFENAYYFSRVFKRYAGMTPSDYHKRKLRPGANAPDAPDAPQTPEKG